MAHTLAGGFTDDSPPRDAGADRKPCAGLAIAGLIRSSPAVDISGRIAFRDQDQSRALPPSLVSWLSLAPAVVDTGR